MPEPEQQRILLRVFFGPHRNKLILHVSPPGAGRKCVIGVLLSDYDKAERSSKPHQNAQIEEVR
jgi:hypothetical protein